MAKINWEKFPPVPGFDSIRMKREIQAKIYEETKDMTREEVREYIRRGAERFDEEQRLRRAERTSESKT